MNNLSFHKNKSNVMKLRNGYLFSIPRLVVRFGGLWMACLETF